MPKRSRGKGRRAGVMVATLSPISFDPRRPRLPRVALISLPGGDSAAWLASALAVRAEVHFLIPDSKVDYLRPDLDSRVRISSFRFSPFYRPLRQARDCWEVTRRIRAL